MDPTVSEVIDGKTLESDLFAVAVSEKNDIKVYHAETFLSVTNLQGHESTITGLSFDKSTDHTLWSSSLDGTVRCWDLRSKPINAVVELKGSNSDDKLEAFTSFDISQDGHLCCAGTEQQEDSEVFVYTWDVRQVKEHGSDSLLFKYEDSHSDDITQVKFHKQSSHTLITGSTDGLIGVFDTSKPTEEEALQHTLNTESSVSKIGFFGSNDEFIYSTTHIETLQFWDMIEGELLGSIDDIRESTKETSQIDYLIDCIYHKPSERLFVAAGTHGGRIELMHSTLDRVEPFQTLPSGHSATVRTISYLAKPDLLYSGDEGGVICCWAPERYFGEKKKTDKKVTKPKSKRDTTKPYVSGKKRK